MVVWRAILVWARIREATLRIQSCTWVYLAAEFNQFSL